MYSTLLVLKVLIFKETKLEHPSNIDSISVTWEVSKYFGLFKCKDSNFLQPLNKFHILSTFLVEKFLAKSSE